MLKLVMYIHSTGVLVLFYIIIVGIYLEMLMNILIKLNIKIKEEAEVKLRKEMKKAIGELMREEIKRELEVYRKYWSESEIGGHIP